MADWITTYRYAHRGLHDAKSDLPENSLAAFRAAATHGYGIELDVQLAACGTPVARALRQTSGPTPQGSPIMVATMGLLCM
jgi:hypothetical protein